VKEGRDRLAYVNAHTHFVNLSRNCRCLSRNRLLCQPHAQRRAPLQRHRCCLPPTLRCTWPLWAAVRAGRLLAGPPVAWSFWRWWRLLRWPTARTSPRRYLFASTHVLLCPRPGRESPSCAVLSSGRCSLSFLPCSFFTILIYVVAKLSNSGACYAVELHFPNPTLATFTSQWTLKV